MKKFEKAHRVRRGYAAKVSSPVLSTRKIHDQVRLFLFVRAGGRCEFDGCNEYLMSHHVTLAAGNFAQMAHIVAFREDGPRGSVDRRPSEINNVENLMLLCPACHKLIDDRPQDFTRQALQTYKRAHEARIKHVTNLGPDRQTVVLTFKALIGGQTVSIPFDQIAEATAPRYPSALEPLTIDLTSIPCSDHAYMKTACETIRQRVGNLFTPEGEATKLGHVSVFALGPIPLLVWLGRQLTNKVPNDIYQRHRDTENWTWKTGGKSVRYFVRRIRAGSSRKVAVILSLSGKIRLDDLPKDTKRSTVYEMSLQGQVSSPTFLRMRKDLEGFRMAYHELISQITRTHGLLDKVDLYPAVPAPIAVLCGRELLPKAHPKLRVFDYDKTAGGFNFKLEV